MSDPNLAYQFNGPYIQTLMQSVQTEIDLQDSYISYLYSLTIENAGPTELATIGGIIGYPWPTAPGGTFDTNSLILGDSDDFPETDNLTGLGSTSNPSIGGLLGDTTPPVGSLIPSSFYKVLLTQVAYLKYNGLSLVSVDNICHVFADEYTITVIENGDIEIEFITDIGAGYLWIVQHLFDRFTTSPQVFASQT